MIVVLQGFAALLVELKLSSWSFSRGAAVQGTAVRGFPVVLGKMAFLVLLAAPSPAEVVPLRFFRGAGLFAAAEQGAYFFKNSHEDTFSFSASSLKR